MPAVSSLTPLAVASLALLAERPMHPYEMYQLLIQRSQDQLVKVRPGSLYHTVDRLVQADFVRAVGTEREGNRPERTTYEITVEGRGALSERIAGMLGTPHHEFPQFPVAIGEAHVLDRETVLKLLGSRLEQRQSDLSSVEEQIERLEQRGLARRYWLSAEYVRATMLAEVAWLQNILGEIERGDLPWESAALQHPQRSTKDNE
ncbi:PadR family transcriptional regulator [Lysinibacter cavernae]|uniref:DNA-binding PadR family transcriptional regulator n=1 Tax=Lysinibacter cavernae TaxID=1640652 RepID=A0A7X5TUY4_9MICO|nr:PadR family transcriptional regulator [Lysinibacter cavernae]NIH54142.1 DNA-binding PadR family transcriptional regulator [Lysinibacter cavernae]